MENRKFGKLINDYLVYAQTTIMYNDTIVSNPTDEQYKKCGYKEVVDDKKIGDVITYTEDDTTITINHSISLDNARQYMTGLINDYDKNENVNIFFLNGIPIWLDGEKRLQLRNAVKDTMDNGGETYGLCIDNVGIVQLPCEQIIAILQAVELYAIQCYQVTFLHIEEVKKLEDIDTILNYPYTEGYPTPLHFGDEPPVEE